MREKLSKLSDNYESVQRKLLNMKNHPGRNVLALHSRIGDGKDKNE